VSTHYLVDPFTASSHPIIDVTTPKNGTTDSTGGVLIRVPDGIAIHGSPPGSPVTNLAALLAAKEAGLLAHYAGFSTIKFDECLTAGKVDLSKSARVLLGAGLAHPCILSEGNLVTTVVSLPAAPSVCVVTWEVYSCEDNDPRTGRFSRVYAEQPSGLLTCEASFKAASSTPTLNGAVLNIPAAAQGTQLTLKFTNSLVTNPAATRLYLGSWAVIY